MKDLEPNESQSIPLTFQVVDGGTQCHVATVTADGADPVSQKGCVTVRQASLEVTITGDRTRQVGEIAEFKTVVKNTGDVAATNIELVIHCDPAIVPTMAERGYQQLANGDILLKIDRLEPSERRTFGLNGQCRSDSKRACARATVTADGSINQAAEACVEILPPLHPRSPGSSAAPAGNNLRLIVTTTKNPARVGEKQLINVIIENAGQVSETKVSMRVIMPSEFTVDATQIQPQGQATINGNEIDFATIAKLPAGQQQQYVIGSSPEQHQ